MFTLNFLFYFVTQAHILLLVLFPVHKNCILSTRVAVFVVSPHTHISHILCDYSTELCFHIYIFCFFVSCVANISREKALKWQTSAQIGKQSVCSSPPPCGQLHLRNFLAVYVCVLSFISGGGAVSRETRK